MTWTRIFYPWTMLSAGLRHGRHGFPGELGTIRVTTWNPDGSHMGTTWLSHFEAEILAIAEAQITKLVALWLKVMHRLAARLNGIRDEYTRLTVALVAVEVEHRRLGYREPWALLSMVFYAVYMLLVPIPEMAWNALVFKKMNMLPEEAYAMAAGITLTCQLMAHTCGTSIRQACKSDPIRARRVAMTLIGIAVLAMAIGAVTVLRALGTESNTLALGLLNASFILGGMVAAFFAHGDAELHRVVKLKKTLNAKRDRIRKQWAKLVARLDAARSKHQQHAIWLRDDCTAGLVEYRRGQVLSTPGATVPTHLSNEVDSRLFRPRPEFGTAVEPVPAPLPELPYGPTAPEPDHQPAVGEAVVEARTAQPVTRFEPGYRNGHPNHVEKL